MAKSRMTTSAAIRRLYRAHQEVAAAREALALATATSAGPLFAGKWRAPHAALREHRDRLSKIPGVVGHGLGYRIKDGIETDERCIVVFVRAKRSPPDLRRAGHAAIPKSFGYGKQRIPTDVIRLGPVHRHAGPGSVGEIGVGEFGTIGALATDTSNRRVAITAMHVSSRLDLDERRGDSPLAMTIPSGGAQVGRLVLGTTSGIDAAKVVLDHPEGVLRPLPVRDFRHVIGSDIDTAAHLFGAASGGVLDGVIKKVGVDLRVDRGRNLVNTFLVSIPTADGDSGAGLIDSSGFLLGFLYGRAPTDLPFDYRVFCPADAVMSFLGCRL